MSVNIYNSNPNASSEAENFQTVANRGSNLAENVIYDNTNSGLTSVNVQDAIDELDTDITRINTDLTDWIAYNNYFIESDTSHANVTEVDINNANAEVNLPHLVWQKGSGTALIGMPSDISGGWLGVRYVHYFNTQNIVIELLQLGSTTSFNRYYRKYNGTTWGSWYKTSATVVS